MHFFFFCLQDPGEQPSSPSSQGCFCGRPAGSLQSSKLICVFTVRHAAGEERLLTLDTQSFFSNPSPPPPSLAFLLARVDAEYAILDMGIQPVHSEGDQPWDFFGRNNAKAETPVLWPPHAKSWLIGKDSDAGRDWGQEEKGTTEDEMAGWHHWLDGCESRWTPGVSDGQGGLAFCNSWVRKESDTTERLNWTEGMLTSYSLHLVLFISFRHLLIQTCDSGQRFWGYIGYPGCGGLVAW